MSVAPPSSLSFGGSYTTQSYLLLGTIHHYRNDEKT